MVARAEHAESRPTAVGLRAQFDAALILLPLLFLFLIVALVIFPAFGYGFVVPGGYGILVPGGTGSMEPSINGGSLLIARRTNPANLRVGDVISFTRPSDGEHILHRIVNIREGASHQRWFTTKGDANTTPDAEVVTLDIGDTYKVIANYPSGLRVLFTTWLSLAALSLFVLGARYRIRTRAYNSRLVLIMGNLVVVFVAIQAAVVLGSVLRILLA